jgi:hypothetical protein
MGTDGMVQYQEIDMLVAVLVEQTCRNSTFLTTNSETTVSMIRRSSVTGLVNSIDRYIFVSCVTQNFTAGYPTTNHLADTTTSRALWPVNFAALLNLHIIASCHTCLMRNGLWTFPLGVLSVGLVG